MKILCLLAALAFADCAQVATVTVVKPHLAPGIPNAGADRLAQQLIRRALHDERSQRLVALASLVEAAEISAQQLDRNPAGTDARHDYNFAVERIFGVMRDAKLTPWKTPVRLGSRTLAWQPHPRALWNPALYDLIPADQLKLGGNYVDVRETKDGIGAPLVAKRAAEQLRDYAPTPHFFYTATGVARFEGSRCVLAIEDPMESETTRLGRRTFPLAADYTAPLAMMLVEMHPKELGLPRLLHPAKFPATTRIARLEPYDPNNAFVVALHDIPIKSGVPYHVIAGDRGRGDAPNSSDGLVPYSSSHLPAAKSEKIVPAHHNAHQAPDAIAEMHRILTLHSK